MINNKYIVLTLEEYLRSTSYLKSIFEVYPSTHIAYRALEDLSERLQIPKTEIVICYCDKLPELDIVTRDEGKIISYTKGIRVEKQDIEIVNR
jgi:hypothetical protein